MISFEKANQKIEELEKALLLKEKEIKLYITLQQKSDIEIISLSDRLNKTIDELSNLSKLFKDTTFAEHCKDLENRKIILEITKLLDMAIIIEAKNNSEISDYKLTIHKYEEVIDTLKAKKGFWYWLTH